MPYALPVTESKELWKRLGIGLIVTLESNLRMAFQYD